jgi:hypothetical protein
MRTLVLLVIVAAFSACSFYESREYRIADGAHRDAAKVRQIVQQIGMQVGLANRTLATHIDHHHPIANFSDMHTSIEAYSRDKDIELSLTRSDWPPPLAFRRADRLLPPALAQRFGRRFSVLPRSESERIIVVH